MLEQGSRDTLVEAGVGERLERDGLIHGGIYLRFDGATHHIPMSELTGRSVTIYGQTEVTKDLIEARVRSDAPLLFDCEEVSLDGLDADEPMVAFRHADTERQLRAEVVAGCDGFHGVCRRSDPERCPTDLGADLPVRVAGHPCRGCAVDGRADLCAARAGICAAQHALEGGQPPVFAGRPG